MSKSVKRICADSIIRGKHIRVAMIGAKGSGKTALITAIRSNLERHSPEWLGSTCKVTVKKIEEKEKLNHQFDYDGACSELMEGNYPNPTTDWSVMRIRLKVEVMRPKSKSKIVKRVLGKWRVEYVVLDILDIPGERVADFLMAEKTFKEWSVALNKKFRANSQYGKYLTEVHAQKDPTVETIVEAYKDFLVSIYNSKSTYYTPSTVRLTQDGNTFTAKSEKELRDWLAQRAVGLRDNEFAPLPPEVFDAKGQEKEKWAKVIASFVHSYRRYNKEVLKPLLNWIWDVDQVYYLCDILSLLRHGRSAYDLEALFGEVVFHEFRKEKSPYAGIGVLCDAWHKITKTEVDQVHLVVTKADRVPFKKVVSASGKTNAMCLADLMSQLHRPSVGHYNLICDTPIVCAAMPSVSGYDRGGEGGPIGRFNKDNYNDSGAKDVPDVPERWPTDPNVEWKPEETYKYLSPSFINKIDLRTAPVPSINLELVLKCILKDIL